MRANIYKTRNNIDKVLNKNNTLFLDEKEYKEVISHVKKNMYKIYKPYKDSEKVILYYNEKPDISLIKIESYNKLKHNQILGSLLSLNIDNGFLGDIIIDEENYYFYIISDMKDYVINNLNYIGSNSVKLKEIDIDYLTDYEKKYEEIELIVSSLRIDSIVSKIINSSRDKAIEKIKDKCVIVNYEVVSKNSYLLKEGDIFSIRRYGKYKYICILKTTKSNNLIIKCLKYI